MSLFDDEFYSTRPSFGNRWSFGGRRLSGARNERGISVRMALFFACLGAAIALVAVWAAGWNPGGGYASAEERVVCAVEKVMPSVVSVVSTMTNGDPKKGPAYSMGVGSGVVFHKENGKALIITNHHVVQDATKVEVVLADGTRKTAKIVGSDLFTDLAVLETDGRDIHQVAQFGNSEKLRPGETAIAIGSPLGLGLSQSITIGVISGPQRRIPVSLNMDGQYDWEMDVIQTDAAINQGNSGGALVNLEGKVIGINSMKIADTGVEGLGFALPIHQVLPVVESLVQYGKVKRPKMGVRTVELDEYEEREALKLPESVTAGLVIVDVPEGPALEAGLQAGDVIVGLDDRPVGTTLELRQYLYGQKKIGDKLKVTYYRNGKKDTVTLKLGEY